MAGNNGGDQVAWRSYWSCGHDPRAPEADWAAVPRYGVKDGSSDHADCFHALITHGPVRFKSEMCSGRKDGHAGFVGGERFAWAWARREGNGATRHRCAHRLKGEIGRAAAQLLDLKRDGKRNFWGRCRATARNAQTRERNRCNSPRRPSRDLHLPHHLAQHLRVDHPGKRRQRLGKSRVPRQSCRTRQRCSLVGGKERPVHLERHQAEISDLWIGRESDHDVDPFIDELPVEALAPLLLKHYNVTEVETETRKKAGKPVTRAFREAAAHAETKFARDGRE